MRLITTTCIALALAGCTTSPSPRTEPAAPPIAGAVTADPVRDAKIAATSYFARPQRGQPAATARAIANIEYLAATLPRDPRYRTAPGAGLTALQLAQREARTALGIPRSAAANDVVTGLRDAAIALEANDTGAAEAALPRNIFTLGPAQTIQRLGQPPRVPSARTALASLDAIGN